MAGLPTTDKVVYSISTVGLAKMAGVSGGDSADNYIAAIVPIDGVIKSYLWVSDSTDAHDPPNIIMPETFTSQDGRWIAQ